MFFFGGNGGNYQRLGDIIRWENNHKTSLGQQATRGSYQSGILQRKIIRSNQRMDVWVRNLPFLHADFADSLSNVRQIERDDFVELESRGQAPQLLDSLEKLREGKRESGIAVETG